MALPIQLSDRGDRLRAYTHPRVQGAVMAGLVFVSAGMAAYAILFWEVSPAVKWGAVVVGAVVAAAIFLYSSRHFRLEVRAGIEVRCGTSIGGVWRREECIPWAEVTRAVCCKRSYAESPDELRLVVHRTDGSVRTALHGEWSEGVAGALAEHFGAKYERASPASAG